MDSVYPHHEFHDLRLMEAQPLNNAYPTFDDLINEPPIGQTGYYDNNHVNQYQQPDSQGSYEYEPMLILPDVREVSTAEIAPDSTGHMGYQLTHSANNMIPGPSKRQNHNQTINSPCEGLNQNLTMTQVTPANPGRKNGHNNEIVTPNINKLEQVPATKVLTTTETHKEPVKSTSQWNVPEEIKSQIRQQSRIPTIKAKDNCGKSSRRSRKTGAHKVTETTPSQSKSSRNKPTILTIVPPSPSVNKISKYHRLKSLVNSLEDVDRSVVKRHNKIHYKETKTGTIMYNLTVELARLQQEDQLWIMAQYHPDKLKPQL